MKIRLNPEIVLIFYDLPRLFVGADQVGTKYLCVFVDSIDEKARYLCRPVSSDEIIKLVKKRIDLRAAFLENDMDCWFYLDTQDEESFCEPKYIALNEVPERYLPKAGVFLNYSLDVDEKLIEDAYRRDKAILCLSIEEGYHQTISAYSLADVVTYFQSIVKYTYKKAMSELSQKIKEVLDVPENYRLNAYASQTGSFKLYLESPSARSLFDGFEINYAFERINSLIVDDDEEIINGLKSNCGHAVQTYAKLLETITKNNLSLKIEWIDPNEAKTTSKSILPVYANKVLTMIRAREELAREEVILKGSFELADTKTGNWRIVDEQGKTYSGVGDGDLLKDKTTTTRMYQLFCDELIEEESISGREKKKYVLNRVLPT